ncbi:type 1 glutamine amidotransferase [Gammaproteobacteria bacterium]|nr:type 1 glutamine amidotransferase [Gammaproteobacteria bacterium]
MASQHRILVLQHIAIEHPGIFRSFLMKDGITWQAVQLDAGEPIPALDGYDALWVMGGPMDVWQKEQYSWLAPEVSVIGEAVVDRKMPYLGLCLGHQLLAEALGGRVGPSDRPEIGILDVGLTDSGKRNPLFEGLPHTFRCLQWHSAEVVEAPAGIDVLASTEACRVQAISVNGNALGLQYHVEITGQTVPEWAEVPEYKLALERHLGSGAVERMALEAAENMDNFNQSARTIYDNWTASAFG